MAEGEQPLLTVLSPSQIAEMLYADRPTATVIIRNLRRNGWVAKERDPENRRRFRVVITPRGRQKVQEVKQSGFRGNPSLKLEAVFSSLRQAELLDCAGCGRRRIGLQPRPRRAASLRRQYEPARK